MKIQNFIGHEEIRDELQKSISSSKLAHAHIIAGEDGIGKSLLAEEMALSILGAEEIREYADIYKFKKFSNKNSMGVDEIRQIVDEINKKPVEGNKKVIIIYRGDKMTENAQNAFLKTVEEPPAGVYIIILSESLELILDTIKSRCQVHKLTNLSYDEMNLIFKEKELSLNPQELRAVLAYADGVPGRAYAFLNDEEYKAIREECLMILLNVYKYPKWKFLDYEEFLTKNKNKIEDVFQILISFIRDTMVYKETNNEKLIGNQDKLNEVKELSSIFSFNKLNDIIEVVDKTRSSLRSNVNSTIAFEVMLSTIQEELYGKSRRNTF